MTALLVLAYLGAVGEPAVIKHREVSTMAQCREDAAFLRERGRVQAACSIVPSRESFGHHGMEPRKGRLA